MIKGFAASPGTRRGPARIVRDRLDLDAVRDGEVLVAEFTHPDLVLAFDRALAVVTDVGGRLSHAAVVAREMGIPAVVGTATATAYIHTGAIVTVDGTAGTVDVAG